MVIEMERDSQCDPEAQSATTKSNPLNSFVSSELENQTRASERSTSGQNDSLALHQTPQPAPAPQPTPPLREPFPFAGLLGALMTSLAGSVAVLCIKLLPVEATVQEKAKACMIRGMFMLLYSSLGVLYRGYSFKLPRDEYLINFLRTFFGSSGMMLNYIALNFITIGESTAIIYASPVWTCVLSFLILGEPFKLSVLVALPASLLGIVLLAKPDLLVGGDTYEEVAEELGLDASNLTLVQQLNSSNLIGDEEFTVGSPQTTLPGPAEEGAELDYYMARLPGILAALSVSFLMAFIIIVLKYRKRTPIETCTFYLSIGTILVSAGLQCVIGFGAMPSTWFECALHFYIGTISYSSQYLFQWALQYVPAGIYSVARSADIMFAFLMGAIFLHDLIPWTSIVGSILIILVVAILVVDEHLVRGFRRMFCLGSAESTTQANTKL